MCKSLSRAGAGRVVATPYLRLGLAPSCSIIPGSYRAQLSPFRSTDSSHLGQHLLHNTAKVPDGGSWGLGIRNSFPSLCSGGSQFCAQWLVTLDRQTLATQSSVHISHHLLLYEPQRLIFHVSLTFCENTHSPANNSISLPLQ